MCGNNLNPVVETFFAEYRKNCRLVPVKVKYSVTGFIFYTRLKGFKTGINGFFYCK